MKHMIFLIAFISCLAAQAYATKQVPDIVIYDGGIYKIFEEENKDFPLELLWKDPNIARPAQVLTEYPGGLMSTACHRGYVAIWEVEKGVLYLKGLDAWQGEKKVNLKLLFPKRFKDGKIKADWFTGILKLNTGDRTNPVNTIDIQFNKGEQSTSKSGFSTLSDNNLHGSTTSFDTITQIASTILVARAEEESYIKEYKPSIEDEILFNRIQAIEENNHMKIYDFVYHLKEGDELIFTIEAHRNGEPDKLKSMIMRVTWHRSRFSQKGMGIFRIIEKQSIDGSHKFSWYFDFDSGGGYGLSTEHYAYKTSRIVLKEDAELDKDRLIFHRYSEQNEFDIKIKAKIVKAVEKHNNPVLEKLYK